MVKMFFLLVVSLTAVGAPIARAEPPTTDPTEDLAAGSKNVQAAAKKLETAAGALSARKKPLKPDNAADLLAQVKNEEAAVHAAVEKLAIAAEGLSAGAKASKWGKTADPDLVGRVEAAAKSVVAASRAAESQASKTTSDLRTQVEKVEAAASDIQTLIVGYGIACVLLVLGILILAGRKSRTGKQGQAT